MLHLAGTWALLQIDPANDENVKAAIPELTTALSNENPEIRREAALALGQIGPRAATAVGKLQPLLKDKSPAVKVESLVALAEIGSASQPAVADIDSLLTDADPGIRPIACYALGRIGAPAKSSVPKLQKMLSSRIPHERTIAAWSLVQIHPEPETVKVAIPLLADAIHGARNPNVRIQAAEALGKVGSGSSVAKDALQTAANDADPAVKKAATEALAKLK